MQFIPFNRRPVRAACHDSIVIRGGDVPPQPGGAGIRHRSSLRAFPISPSKTIFCPPSYLFSIEQVVGQVWAVWCRSNAILPAAIGRNDRGRYRHLQDGSCRKANLRPDARTEMGHRDGRLCLFLRRFARALKNSQLTCGETQGI